MSHINIEIGTKDGTIRLEVPLVNGCNTVAAITLTDLADRKSHIVEVIRHFTGMTLKDAKTAAESLPRTFEACEVTRGTLEHFKANLEAEGGTVTSESGNSSECRKLTTELLAVIARHVEGNDFHEDSSELHISCEAKK